MHVLEINLNERLSRFVEEQVASGRHSSAVEYVLHVIREAQIRDERERIKQLALEGVRSGSKEMTPADWNIIRGGHAPKKRRPASMKR
jgi:antitoxin ParD1/3/4